MIIPQGEQRFNMNQFIYVRSIKENKNPKHALINEALDIGLLPCKNYYQYGLIEINKDTRAMVTTKFDHNEKALMTYLHQSKASDLILFTYSDTEWINGAKVPIDIMPTLTGDKLPSKFAFMGYAMVINRETYNTMFTALGINLRFQDTVHKQKESFLADFALLENDDTKFYLMKPAQIDFLIMKYDVYGDAKDAQIEKIYIGSNNDSLRVSRNDKFLYVSNEFVHMAGGRRKERGGRIMGGNVLAIDFYNGEHEVLDQAFLMPFNYDLLKTCKVVDSKVLNIVQYSEKKKLLHYDETHKAFTNLEFPNDTPSHFRNGMKLEEFLERNQTPYPTGYHVDDSRTSTTTYVPRSDRILTGESPEIETIVFRRLDKQDATKILAIS